MAVNKKMAIGLAVVAAAVAYTGASGYMGKRAEEHVQKQVSAAAEEMKKRGLPITLRLEGYRRGIFRSTGKVFLDIGLPWESVPRAGEPVFFSLASSLIVEHGPLPWGQLASGSLRPVLSRIHYFLEKDPEYQEAYDFFAEPHPLSAHLSIGFDKRARGTLHLSPGNLSDENVTLAFSGGDGPMEIQYDAGGQVDWTQLDFKAKSFSFGKRGTAPVVANGLEYTVDRKNVGGFSVGKVGFNINDVAFAVAGRDWAARNLGFSLNSRLMEGRLDTEMLYALDELKAGDLDFGGGQIVRLDFGGFDGQALRDFYASWGQASADQAAFSENTLMEQALREKLGAVLKDGIHGTIGHHWKTAEGESRMQARAVLKNLDRAVRDPNDALSESPAGKIAHFLDTLDADVRLSMPMMRALAQNFLMATGEPIQSAQAKGAEMAEYAALGMQQRYRLKREGDDLVLRLGYGDGLFILNDEKLAPEALLLLLGYGETGGEEEGGE